MYKKTTSNIFRQKRSWKSRIPDRKNLLCKIKLFFIQYPKAVFASMIVSILFSLGCFLIYPKPAPEKQSSTPGIIKPISSSVKGLLTSASVVKEIIMLQKMVESTFEKDSLNKTDSLLIKHAVEKIHALESMMLKP